MAGFQQVNIADELKFVDKAAHSQNVDAYFNPKKIMVEYNFTELVLDNTNKYTPYLDTTSTVALGIDGLLITTAATDTKVGTQTQGGIWWYPNKNAVVEMKLKVDVITNVAIFTGFSDAVSEASGLLPFGISGDTLTDTASNAAGLLFDTRQTLDYFNVVNTKANADAFTQLPSTRVPVADTWLILRTEFEKLSTTNILARYYWNGVQVGYKENAVTATTPLIPFVGIRNNSAAAHILTVRYVRCWADS